MPNTSPPAGAAPERRSAIVIVNGRAGQAGRLWSEQRVRDGLGPSIEPRFVYPTSPDDTTASARRAIDARADVVIVAGGDGTVNRVAGALAGSSVALAILPLGTGNDLVRTLGLPQTLDDAVAGVAAAEVRPFDLVEVNGDPSCTVGLLGGVADSAARVIRLARRGSRWRPVMERLGAASWRLSGTMTLISPGIVRHLTISYEGPGSGRETRFERDAVGVFLANGTRLGGGLSLPVGSRVDDGVFEMCVVNAVLRPKLLYAFTCLMRGWTLPRGVLDVYPCTRARITLQRPGPFSADGELFAESTSFDARVRPGALQVLRPV
jgi:diacylglycerol kinase family enzyme